MGRERLLIKKKGDSTKIQAHFRRGVALFPCSGSLAFRFNVQVYRPSWNHGDLNPDSCRARAVSSH